MIDARPEYFVDGRSVNWRVGYSKAIARSGSSLQYDHLILFKIKTPLHLGLTCWVAHSPTFVSNKMSVNTTLLRKK